MERLKSMFKSREQTSHYKRKASIVSMNESVCDSIYGVTSSKQLIINDVRSGKNLSIGILNYILTNFTESEKYELLVEYNSALTYYYNLVNK